MILRNMCLLCILAQVCNFAIINAYSIHSILLTRGMIKHSKISHDLTLYLFNNRKMVPIDQPKITNDKKTNKSDKGNVNDNISRCKICNGKEVIDCKFCLGTGKDKINGNVLERWTCNKCKGFGLVVCSGCTAPSQGSFKTGLTPEQRGER